MQKNVLQNEELYIAPAKTLIKVFTIFNAFYRTIKSGMRLLVSLIAQLTRTTKTDSWNKFNMLW